MSDHELKSLLKKLHEELENTEEVEAETLALVRQLDSDIHQLVQPAAPTGDSAESPEAVLDRARQLRNQFAANHPVAERFVSEIMDTLAKLGI